MCTVYRALELNMERVVALKFLRAHLTGNPEAVKRFQREAVAIAALEHPLIVKVFGFGLWQSHPYIVLEYLDGKSLAHLLATEERLPMQRVQHLFAQICDALVHAHGQGVVHRDLKPSNVMLIGATNRDQDQDQIKLVDFGIAKILPESSTEMQALTRSGDLVGSVSYMSPEQLAAREVDARSDIYSLGCLMYETLEGQPPFVGETSFEIAAAHLNDAPPRGTHLAELQGIIHACLSKSPDHRPQSAAELKSMLANPRAAQSKFILPVGRRLNRRQALIAFAALLMVSGVVLTILVKRIEDQTRAVKQLEQSLAPPASPYPHAVTPTVLLKKQQAQHFLAAHEWDKAIPHLTILVDNADSFAPQEKTGMQLRLAYCNLQAKHFTRAQAVLQDLEKRPLSLSERFTVLTLKADLNTETRQFKQALPLRIESLKLARQMRSQIEPTIKCGSILQTAVAYERCGEYDKALPLFDESLSISTPNARTSELYLELYINGLIESGSTHIKLAARLLDRGAPDANKHYETGIKKLQEATAQPTSPNSTASHYAEKGQVLLRQALKRNWYRQPEFLSPVL